MFGLSEGGMIILLILLVGGLWFVSDVKKESDKVEAVSLKAFSTLDLLMAMAVMAGATSENK